jgi:hypothetical protein
MIIIILSIGICASGENGSSQMRIGEQHLTLQEARELLKQEIEKLRAATPVLFKERQVDKFVHVFAPLRSEADLLYCAAELSNYDLDKLHKEFPVFSYIYNPVFIGDLDGDEENEILCVPDLEPSDTYLFIFKQEKDTITLYQKIIDVYRMQITVQELPNGEQQIVARSEDERRIPIKGTNDLLTLEYAREMVLKFTGDAIEEVRPLMIVDERIVLDE